MAQTQFWTDALEHPVVGWGRQQDDDAGQAPQSLGQELQFSPNCASHAPLPQQLPQSLEQELQSSPNCASHAPLPQQLPQSLEHVLHVSAPLQAPSPHTGLAQPPQPRLVTSSTQRLSQELLQQNGSDGHTHCSVDSLSQPGLPWVAQQSPLHDPHWSASPAQRLSHWLLQQ
jgi:hypothetical protein